MPRDGTVFQLTCNVILFLQQIHEFVDTLAMILTQDTSYNQTLLRLPRKISVSERNPALVGLYIKKVLASTTVTGCRGIVILYDSSYKYKHPLLPKRHII